MKKYETPDIVEMSCNVEGVLCLSPSVPEDGFGNAGDLIIDKE